MQSSKHNDKSKAKQSQAHLSYRCPKCGSNAVREHYPEIQCLSCGYSEPFIDFPISWDFYRHYSLCYTGHDPGPNLPPEHTVDELSERLETLEEHFAGLSQEELKTLRLKQLKDELGQLRLGLRYTQRLIPHKRTTHKQPQRITTKGVEL